jgi:hypothetical protein
METDPNDPYGKGSGGGSSYGSPPDDDFGWWGVIDGVWQRMTNPAPYTGETS